MITIIDYNMGNIASIQNMLKKIGAESVVTSDLSVIENAEKLILPGVGSFDYGMENLNKLGIAEVLKRKVVIGQTPILGICLGMQLMTKSSEEGNLPGLAFFDAETVRFQANQSEQEMKIPHMGWNYIKRNSESPLLRNLDEEARFYFVHSYYVKCNDVQNALAYTNYGGDFVSAISKGNAFGVQFHPEKSHKYGMILLNNFVELI